MTTWKRTTAVWLASAIKGAGYIPGRNGPQLVESCVERLRRGRSQLIFPEGTRSPKDGLGALGRGAAHIALRSGCDLVPVTIECQPATLYRGLAWWDVPERRFIVTLNVDAPLSIEVSCEVREIASNNLRVWLSQWPGASL